MTHTYQPKGSMCLACTKAREDCSRLDFKSMPVLFRLDLSVKVVKCTEFNPSSIHRYLTGAPYA